MDPAYLARLGWLAPAPTNFRDRLRSALADGVRGGTSLRQLAMTALKEAELTQLGRAVASARETGTTWPDLLPFRLAVLCNGTAEHLIAPLIGSAVRCGINLEVMASSYEEAFVTAAGDEAPLRNFAPDAVLIAVDYRGLPLRRELADPVTERNVIDDSIGYLQAMYEGVRRSSSSVIAQTIARPPLSVFGNAAKKIAGSLPRIIDEVNHFVCKASSDTGPLLNVATLAEVVGTAAWFDTRLWHVGKIPFSMNFVPLYADHVARIIGALLGKSRRVLVTDLDNTLWGGDVGDDGVDGIVIGNGSPAGEAFLDLQRKLLDYRQRGVLLAVASKNDETQARRPFREIPEMALREDDFSAFHANWSDKATSLEEMALELSLGLDSFVFVDDNPAERELVRQLLPEVAVLELSEDPSDYAAALVAAGYFEPISISDEDAQRADLYRNRQAIVHLAPHDLAAYLDSLKMELVIERVHAANRARIVQLINKSNQFNLTTRRCSDAEVEAIENDPNCAALALRLTDRLDDHGIISVILCEKNDRVLSIVLWVMSCRVIGRDVERAALGYLVDLAKQRGCDAIRGQYIPTPRNKLVETHYSKLGFAPEGQSAHGTTTWLLPVATAELQVPRFEIVKRT